MVKDITSSSRPPSVPMGSDTYEVLVVGAGPVGMITALSLARRGVRCVLVERNLETTRWPKMDITNCRSMELLRRLGLADGLREIGVPSKWSFDVYCSTGLSDGGEVISKWDLPSPDWWTEQIKTRNDGSMPLEPYQRCSQALFEAWLKLVVQKEVNILSHWGLKFENLVESDDGVESTLTDSTTLHTVKLRTQYVVGCDGAGSRVRRSVGKHLVGGPVSRDLSRLQRQGQFWHIFFTNGSAIIAQDEVDTWTTHYPIALDVDPNSLDPHEYVYKTLGGSGNPFEIAIDEILVTSSYRPNICIADSYRSRAFGRVFLAGDAAHQNIPTGGYGMNTGLGDAFDISWKLAAVLNGYAGDLLLDSYELERMPVGIQNIERSGVHSSVHQRYCRWIADAGGNDAVTGADQVSQDLRARIKKHWDENDGENKDHGIELGYRHVSPVVLPEPTTQQREPGWSVRDYVPSTWPGVRSPHVWLEDGKTSIHHLFGPEYSLVDFTPDGRFAMLFQTAATNIGCPLIGIHLPHERHVHDIWACHAALIRPDDFVAWRAVEDPAATDGFAAAEAHEILRVVLGHTASVNLQPSRDRVQALLERLHKTGFSGTVGNVDQEHVQALGAFQR